MRLAFPTLVRAAAFVAVVLAGSVFMGCSPEIGDDCSNSTDCSTTGDRLCDTTQPGGYCTLFNCEPDRCPEEASCVSFDHQLAPAEGCNDPQRWARFERTFCLKTCESNGDCRGGYVCATPADLASGYQGRVIDAGNPGARVCIVATRRPAPMVSEEPPAVCQPSGPDFEVPYTPTDNPGTGGAGGQGGAAGQGGAGQSGGGGDAGQGGSDAGQGGSDAGQGGSDAGQGGSDAGQGGSDAGQGGSDAGQGGSDAGQSGAGGEAGVSGQGGSAGQGGDAGAGGAGSGGDAGQGGNAGQSGNAGQGAIGGQSGGAGAGAGQSGSAGQSGTAGAGGGLAVRRSRIGDGTHALARLDGRAHGLAPRVGCVLRHASLAGRSRGARAG